MTPSQQLEKGYPWSSIAKNSESEVIFLNILKILSQTGNIWRTLTWDEYKEQRLKDGNFTSSEEHYFNKVLEYTASFEKCEIFRRTEEIEQEKREQEDFQKYCMDLIIPFKDKVIAISKNPKDGFETQKNFSCRFDKYVIQLFHKNLINGYLITTGIEIGLEGEILNCFGNSKEKFYIFFELIKNFNL